MRRSPGGAAQTFQSDRDIPADWYGLFQSEPLDDLVRRSLRDSPTVEAAKAALRSAQDTYPGRARGAVSAPGGWHVRRDPREGAGGGVW